MGYWSNGVDIKPTFDVNDIITRAEVGVIISRLLRGNTYAGNEENRYKAHLNALNEAGIMNFISDPMMVELRGNVFIMLQRISSLI